MEHIIEAYNIITLTKEELIKKLELDVKPEQLEDIMCEEEFDEKADNFTQKIKIFINHIEVKKQNGGIKWNL